MILASFQNVVKEYQGEPLFEPVSFDIQDKERIAIVGPNGTGKSTLIKMLIGEVEPSEGNVVVSKNYTIGYLSQGVISSFDHTLIEEAMLVFKDLIKMEKELNELCKKVAENPYDEELLKSYSSLENKFISLDGYNYRYKIDMMLNKFNFSKSDYDRPISSFSGGERMKMAFAKLLLLKPELLVLDEPTNHLDISTIEWLETYLKTYDGSILFVSHDRYFINALANKIFELDNKRLEVYVGDYDKYSVLKKERYEQRLKEYKHQQEEIEKLEWFIRFYMPKPRFVSRAHDREKKLDRIKNNLLEKPKETKKQMNMNISGQIRKGKRLIEVKDCVVGYDKPLIKDINFTLFGGDKMAIMGQNGSGKTTFIKTLRNELKPLGGDIEFLTNLNIGYLKQDGINLNSPLSIFEYFKEKFPLMLDTEVYNHLASYGFSFEDDKKIIDNLSGGERMRIVFAELVLRNYDLLLLDEPTNHLDMMTKQELMDSLKRYEGSLIVISHDRYFVDEVCSKLIYFTYGESYYYEGRYSDFKTEVLDPLEKTKEEEIKAIESQVKQDNKKPAYVNSHEKKVRPRLSKNKIEDKIVKIEEKMAEIKSLYEKEEYYTNPDKLNELGEQEKKLNEEYENLFEQLALYED